MLRIWMGKSYSESESRNSSSLDANMVKPILNCENSHIIVNKYGYVFTSISFEDSLRLFTQEYH